MLAAVFPASGDVPLGAPRGSHTFAPGDVLQESSPTATVVSTAGGVRHAHRAISQFPPSPVLATGTARDRAAGGGTAYPDGSAVAADHAPATAAGAPASS
jgi:hypothetical protein